MSTSKKYKVNTLNYTYESTTSHDKMIEAFQNYFKWQTRFEALGSVSSGIKARYWLSEIRNAATTRRHEIMDLQRIRKAARLKKLNDKQR